MTRLPLLRRFLYGFFVEPRPSDVVAGIAVPLEGAGAGVGLPAVVDAVVAVLVVELSVVSTTGGPIAPPVPPRLAAELVPVVS